MLCDNCKIEKKDSDFINNQKFCYQCEYSIKLKKVADMRTDKNLICRTCGERIIHVENLKKRQRNYFCSETCAKTGHKKQLNNHWTRKILSDTYWKKGK